MFSQLLVPLDGSTAAEAAIRYSTILPARVVTLLTVIPGPDDPGYDWLTDVASETHHEEQRAHALKYLETVAAACQQRGRTIRTVVAQGDPTKRVVEAAKDANLIIMTNHGYGSTSPTAYGRVVDRVARYANKPVLVIRAIPGQDMAPSFSRILVPLDGSDTAGEASPLAMELASQIGVPIHLISVVDPALIPASAIRAAEKLAEGYLASEAERMRSHAIEVTTGVRVGTPAAELIAAAGPSDLIVMTAFGAGTGQRWLLGGVADKLIRSAPAPVLVVRPTTIGTGTA